MTNRDYITWSYNENLLSRKTKRQYKVGYLTNSLPPCNHITRIIFISHRKTYNLTTKGSLYRRRRVTGTLIVLNIT